MKYLMAVFATSACLLGASSVASNDTPTVSAIQPDVSALPVEYLEFEPLVISVKQSAR